MKLDAILLYIYILLYTLHFLLLARVRRVVLCCVASLFTNGPFHKKEEEQQIHLDLVKSDVLAFIIE
jgi:hypothetical protein